MKTPIAIIISGIVIAISIVVSTKMYVDGNKYTFHFDNVGKLYAADQEGNVFRFHDAYLNRGMFRKSFWVNRLNVVTGNSADFKRLDKLP